MNLFLLDKMHGKPVHNELLVLSRSALEACQLHKLFDAPLVAKAVGFEGKVGFIEDLAVRGSLEARLHQFPGI